MSHITSLDGFLYKIGAHGFVYRKDGPDWIKASMTANELIEASREQERREMRAEINAKKRATVAEARIKKDRADRAEFKKESDNPAQEMILELLEMGETNIGIAYKAGLSISAIYTTKLGGIPRLLTLEAISRVYREITGVAA